MSSCVGLLAIAGKVVQWPARAPRESDEARAALRQMRFESGAAYRKLMSAIGADKTILDFDDIDRSGRI